MHPRTRRNAIKFGVAAGLAGTALLLYGGQAHAQVQAADVQPPDLPIEEGAELTVLRPSKFVEGDERLFMENTRKFEEQFGVPVTVQNESWADLRPKTAVAANVGSGPDIVLAWNEDPYQYPDKLVDLSDVAEYLDQKYGGWFPLAELYGQHEGGWIAMPIGASGGKIVYRKSWLEEAGYDEVPQDLEGFLELAKALKEAGHPMGFALGHAEGDANAFANWVLWAHGGKLVNDKDEVVINSPETIEALNYAKELCAQFIPGTLSWLDPSNNKAFLAGEIGLTGNGISIYYAAKNSEDSQVREMAEDIGHAPWPVGPVGRPTENALVVNAMVFDHTPYPNAAKEYLRFMMEQEQYVPWQQASIGYWGHPLQAYDENPVWTEDPEHTVYRDIMKNALYPGYEGSMGQASAAALADFIVVDMVSSVCAGQATPEEAAAEAERRAQRYYS